MRGPGKTVQIDESMLNYKCKSHRGRSSTNRTDALCIVEANQKIDRVFAKFIPNKLQTTILHIISSQVIQNSTILTDEHRLYTRIYETG